MDLPADELQPAKDQTGVIAGEADAGDEDEKQEDNEVAGDQDIPELAESDDGDEKMEPIDRNFVESEDEELDTPKSDPVARRPEDGPALELPDAKRSRLSRITAMQNLCKMEKIKYRNDVIEIIRQLERRNNFDIKNTDAQRKSGTRKVLIM